MNKEEYSPMERISAILDFKEPDRVPFMLGLTLRGAKELNLPLNEYYSSANHIVKAQKLYREKFHHDILSAFFYSAIEFKAWGGKVIFFEDGPPNAGEPLIKNFEQIKDLNPPDVYQSQELLEVIKAVKMLKEEVNDEVPIMGIVTSPFTLPIMQLGFKKYIELIYEYPQLFKELMKINEKFSVQFAKAQLEAGVTALGYSDPMSSPTIIPRDLYLKTGFKVSKRFHRKINGNTVTHLASARTHGIIKDLKKTGTKGVALSWFDHLREVKNLCDKDLVMVGNLNGIEMRRWTTHEAEETVKKVINLAGKGGGFILSDTHGEIPLNVPDKIILAISKAVKKWGKYPLD